MVLRRNKNIAVKDRIVPHYFILVIRKFIDFMPLFRNSVVIYHLLLTLTDNLLNSIQLLPPTVVQNTFFFNHFKGPLSTTLLTNFKCL